MKKLREWIVNKFLPAYAKDTLCRENGELKDEISRLEAELDRLNAYIGGLEDGLQAQLRITIHNEVKR